jgi:hypothetical protein
MGQMKIHTINNIINDRVNNITDSNQECLKKS